MQRDWARLGAELRASREAQGLSQKAMGEMIGIKRGAMANIEGGRVTRISATVKAYARAVGWDEESIETVLAGGEPTTLSPVSQPPRSEGEPLVEPAVVRLMMEAAVPEELPLRIKAALANGPLIDATVINLPADEGDEPDGQMIVIVKGRSTASPERLRRAMQKWEQTEAQLRHGEGA